MSVTTADVQKIYPTTSDLSGFLATAQLIVTEQLSNLTPALSSAMLDQITIYLTAHFAVIGLDKGGLRREKLGDSDESYRVPGDNDIGFRSTMYGQQAMLLDTSGTLAAMGAKAATLPGLFEIVTPNPPPCDW